MTGVSFDNAQLFIYKNARLLERRLFEALYCQGEKRAVVTALKAYQNADGGFGNALEPDVRCPDSQPVSAHVALETLDRVGLLTDPAVHDDVLLPLIGWLESVTTDEGGIPNVLPSANNYPHAPWWTAVDNPPADLNPTAAIVGLLLKSKVNHPWIARAAAYCFTAIEKLDFSGSAAAQYHTLMPVIEFLTHAPDRDRADHLLTQVAELIRRPGMVEMDPGAGGYVKMPLDWAPTPTHFCRALFRDETIALHLEKLAERQQPDGGWSLTWDPISPACEAEWRGKMTLETFGMLRAYGVLKI